MNWSFTCDLGDAGTALENRDSNADGVANPTLGKAARDEVTGRLSPAAWTMRQIGMLVVVLAMSDCGGKVEQNERESREQHWARKRSNCAEDLE
eukprot:CAMPEP_0194503764 /NCGR_PEP_ID=MMETSP0253-20130528/28565_1 /TAXON_ID=2966 /ORGANISM="Noctiluca scintillans" /LENGTH=93 /DNA_ID=CAMNT_0039346079 /DNA_START=218 /DNA_END=498 /DNA_ORIENTATION=+